MTILKTVKLALAVGVSATFLLNVVPAEAQRKNLFERLFQKQFDRRQRLNHGPAPAVAPPVAIKKVSAPKYFGYRLSPLKAVKFAALVTMAHKTMAAAAAVDATTTGTTDTDVTDVAVVENVAAVTTPENQKFLDAMVALEGFDVRMRKDIGKAVVAHYLKNPDFFWVEEGKPTFGSQLAMQLFAKADDVGLMAEDYAVALPPENADARALGEFEMNMSLMAVRYVMDARNGKINPNRLSGYHDFPKVKFGAAQAIAELTSEVSPSVYMAAASPTNDKFRSLRATLATLKNETADGITIAEGTLIKPGKAHDEMPNVVAAIRKKASAELLELHGETLNLYAGTPEYTEELVALVKAFQKEKKLKPDGVVGRNTISRMVDLNPQVKMNRVRLAMERLRWHPRRLGQRHVFINQPAYRARYIQEGVEKLSMRVIIGKRSNQTTFFHDTIERVEFNPYWGVPQSIIINEMLPKLRADPSYLDSRGYEVSTVGGQKISSSSVDWSSVGGGQVPYNVRQLPGARNALGELKILFPNKHAIYMHDTPSRGLFKRTRRALSHGCVRLHDPRGMAAAVLGTTVSHVSSKISIGKNNAQKLSVRIPVYIAYFTAWPNKDGTIEYFADVYGRDKHLGKAVQKISAQRSKAV